MERGIIEMKCIENLGYKLRVALFAFNRKRILSIGEKVLAILGLILTIVEAENLFFETSTVSNLTHKFGIWVFLLAVAVGIISTHTKLTYQYAIKGTDIKLSLSVGDILKTKSPAVVIPTNTTFDTIMENEFISIKSIQGQFQDKFFKNNLRELDRLLEIGLEGLEYCQLERVNTKNKQYPVGTVSKVNYLRKHYYFAAIANVNEHGKTVNPKFENIQETLMGLWDCLADRGHVEEITIPLLGTGRAGIPNVSREKVIKEIIFSIVATSRERALATRFNIVIHPSDFKDNQLDIETLAEYLRYTCEYKYEAIDSHNEGTAI